MVQTLADKRDPVHLIDSLVAWHESNNMPLTISAYITPGTLRYLYVVAPCIHWDVRAALKSRIAVVCAPFLILHTTCRLKEGVPIQGEERTGCVSTCRYGVIVHASLTS